jgi:uncharacterized membrane protein YoaK (UPF0700 family)
MLRHTGAKRSYRHNIRLAVLFCLAAGFINAAGFLAFSVLTTNVTGHAALLALDISSQKWGAARMVSLWIVLFLAGSFVSSLFISKIGREKVYAYSIPIGFIILILLGVALFGYAYDGALRETEYFAGSLLFAMGVQNALVSVISGSVVRTTHLTGMVTDLGIDLSTAFSSHQQVLPLLKRRIMLRLVIILSFLAGAIIGGISFVDLQFHAFYIPIGILMIALFYDYFRIKVTRAFYRGKRKLTF